MLAGYVALLFILPPLYLVYKSKPYFQRATPPENYGMPPDRWK